MIIVELMGGLGNQMFQFALGKNLSIKQNTTLLLDKFFLLKRDYKQEVVYRDYDLNIFNIREQFASQQISRNYSCARSKLLKGIQYLLPSGTVKLVKEKNPVFDSSVFSHGDNIYLHGYWQSVQYFEDIEDIIRSEFVFKESISNHCEDLLNEIRESESVCLNVRRGDFLINPTHGVLAQEFYQKAIKILSEGLINPSIFVFSDDILWCKEHLKFSFKTKFVDHNYAGEKFRDYFELMINCKHFIIPNSSFAWWSAWLSPNTGKIVIAPKIWNHKAHTETEWISPKNWIFI